MTWRFCSGLGDAGQGGEEQLAGVFDEEGAGAQVREVPPHEFGFAFAHHAGVDVGAMNPLRAERAQAQRIGDRGIDAAADEEEDVAAGGDLADVFFEGVHLTGRVPVLGASADVEQEVGEDGLAARRMRDFGMKLDPVEAARVRSHGGHRAGGGGGQHVESFGRPRRPDRGGSSRPAGGRRRRERAYRSWARAGQIELGESVFTLAAFLYRAAQKVRDELLAVADA